MNKKIAIPNVAIQTTTHTIFSVRSSFLLIGSSISFSQELQIANLIVPIFIHLFNSFF